MTVRADVAVEVEPMDFPAGTAGGVWRIDMQGVQTVDSETPSAQFTLEPGTYTATAQRLDVNGAPLGAMASTTFDVPAPSTVKIDVAKGITVTITAI
jgi:hypothetical protein